MIIAGAAALAVTVVLGLAVVKKPYLFGLGEKPAPADIPPAPAAAAPEVPAGPPPITAPPAAIAKQAADAAAPVSAPTPPPVASPAPATPTPVPAAPAAAPAKTPPPQVAGDESLEKMFEELAGESGGNKTGKPGAPKAEAKPVAPVPAVPAAPVATTPAEAIKAEALPEPQAAPAPGHEPAPAKVDPKAEAKAKAEQAKAEAKAKAEQAKAEARTKAEQAKAEAKANPAPKPVAPAAPAAAKPVAGGGNVIRVVAEEKPGEYVLVIQTNKPPANFSRMFMTDPPRLVLDIDGAWNYNGPLSSSTGDAFIRQIRVGKHPDKFRVVLDMAPDATTRLRGAPTAERVPEGVALRIPK
jgi:hypothetical protein